MIQVYKIVRDIDKVAESVIPETHEVATRGHNHKLFKPRARLERRKHSFKHRIVNDWNILPNEVVEAQSVNSFKSRLNKKWVRNNKFSPNCYQPY